MTQTAIDICSCALVKIGAQPISSFAENSAEAQVAVQLYEVTLQALLSAYPWRFALQQKKLNRLAQNPNADYTYAYSLPADFLRAISAGTSAKGKGILYRIYQNQLHTNSENVILTYLSRPLEQNFPPFFTQLLTLKLAEEFTLPLTESTARAEYFNRLFNTAFSNAKLTDAQQSIPSVFQDFSLIEVRS